MAGRSKEKTDRANGEREETARAGLSLFLKSLCSDCLQFLQNFVMVHLKGLYDGIKFKVSIFMTHFIVDVSPEGCSNEKV